MLHHCLALHIISFWLVSFLDSVAWGQSWLTGRCSRAPVSTLVFRLWACGRRCWRKVFSTMVRFCAMSVCTNVPVSQKFSMQTPVCCRAVDQELSFQDKYLFYRFLDDEQEDAPFPSEEERRESQEELQDTLLLLSQIGPDAHMRMILRKQYGSKAVYIKEI